MTDRRRPLGLILGGGVLIAAVLLLLRYWLARTPPLSETYYDEALTGLMALAVLRGEPQVFYWGQPYLGAQDAYLAAAGFWAFGASTLVLRMAHAAISVLWAWSVFSLGRRCAGEGFGLLAGLLVAVPPIFLSYIQLSSHAETIALTHGALTLAAAAWLLDPAAGPRGRVAAWTLLGVAGGLGWWASQMMGMFLVAAALVLLVARPRALRTPGPYLALALFVLASLPFWIWNVRHEWASFRHLATWGGPLPPFPERVRNVSGALVAVLQNFFWDGRAVRLPPPAEGLAWVLVLAIYVPALAVAAARVGTWGRRLFDGERPWQDPLDLVVVAFGLTGAAHLATWFGSSGVLRYSMTFFATLPVLVAVALARLARLGRPGRGFAVVLGVALVGFNALTHLLFLTQSEGQPRRPVDAAIARLQSLGIRACYADSRIAQVIAFESLERIQCADFVGLRNFAFLRAVDAVDDPATVAIVAHRVLRRPDPETVAATLALMGAEPRRDEVGEYVIFHHVRPPDPGIRPIAPARWSARASTSSETAARAFDRRVWTRWTAPKRDGEWFELDLGDIHRLAQLTLEPGPVSTDGPLGLRLETSPNGRVWDLAAQAAGLRPGLHWWKGHPRFDDSGRVIVRMSPRPARYVRLTQLGDDRPGVLWSLGEVFAYEVADTPWTPPPAARVAAAEATAALDRFMDDPGGPHPRRAPVTYAHRRAQVPWAAAFEAAGRALDVAPEWDDAHHLYAQALELSGWESDPDRALARAQEDGAWREVVRWADLAAAELPEFWRSGRDAARVEALIRLGRATEAETARAEAARAEAASRPGRRVHARFGDRLELIGVELPAAVRPGERAEIRYAWRALRRMDADYTAFVHVVGERDALNQDHALGGGGFGTSQWAPGERTRETLTLVVPPETAPGRYEVRVGVWLPATRAWLEVAEADLPRVERAVVVGTLEVTR